ncbi:MAG: ATP-binding protein [Myxococcota bacterium]
MASSARRGKEGRGLAALVSAPMLLGAWLPVLAIGVLHYTVGAHEHWAHDILRRLYYVPILYAALTRGLGGGLAVATVASLSYIPHAFFVMSHSQDPGSTINKLSELLLYQVIGILAGISSDREVARRHQIEQAAAEQERLAEQLVRAGRLAALGELVAGIAHEIKNPLHTLKGTAEIVDEVIPKGSEQAVMWRVLRQEIERLERIAERFLSFARPAVPDLRLARFAQVYERACELLTAHVRGAIDVRFEVVPLTDEVSRTQVRADADQLTQVLLNIASNALRAMEGRGVLMLSAELRGGHGPERVALTLTNDGPAIAEGDLERIFDPFYGRADEGTGLGLAIAERIAEGHGGYLEARNLGTAGGVAFTLVLPRALAAR